MIVTNTGYWLCPNISQVTSVLIHWEGGTLSHIDLSQALSEQLKVVFYVNVLTMSWKHLCCHFCCFNCCSLGCSSNVFWDVVTCDKMHKMLKWGSLSSFPSSHPCHCCCCQCSQSCDKDMVELFEPFLLGWACQCQCCRRHYFCTDMSGSWS